MHHAGRREANVEKPTDGFVGSSLYLAYNSLRFSSSSRFCLCSFSPLSFLMDLKSLIPGVIRLNSSLSYTCSTASFSSALKDLPLQDLSGFASIPDVLQSFLLLFTR